MNADDVKSVPESLDDEAVSLQDLMALEGTHSFQCEGCEAVFATVNEWARHATTAHRGSGLIGVLPLPRA